MYNRYVKRLLDIFLSGAGIIVLSPLLLLLSLWIKLDSPGPVLFTQRRVGRGRSIFLIYKFRTMRADTPHDVPTHLMLDAERYITRSGRFLRKTSLDEIPQLLNILLGQMSVIGPRPALWNQSDLIEAREAYGVNALRPGLTGWAQVNGRDELEIAQKARLDGEYASHVSFGFDVRCFLLTVAAVLHHRGVVEGGTGALSSTSDTGDTRK